MATLPEKPTQPIPRFPEEVKPNIQQLAHGRYGTDDMNDIWGQNQTFDSSLRVVGQMSASASAVAPDIVPPEVAEEIVEKANLGHVDPNRIIKIEEQTGHDVHGITRALDEVVSNAAKPHIARFSTSADTTETARGIQIKRSMEVLARTIENVRDITLEKALLWSEVPHMDQTHLYDALPSVVGRAFAHYGELLQSGLHVMKFFYENSIMGKFADATGNHHQATAAGVDGMRLQEHFCEALRLNHMTAPAQVPGLEYLADIVYSLARVSATLDNLADYIADGRGNDRFIFYNADPKPKKGSVAMPHKDIHRGNPTVEEQNMSMRNKMFGWLTTAMLNTQMPYARNLRGSANARMDFDDGMKFFDHAARRLAEQIYHLGLREDVAIARVTRSLGYPCAQQVMMYLTDPRLNDRPMGRKEAHDIMGDLSGEGVQAGIPFIDAIRTKPEILDRIPENKLVALTDPFQYIGQSKEIIDKVYDDCHGKATLPTA
ncbi:hypothetical protein JW868_00535 [Candidatus Woesearchaeota archaeon]|nr:hypothetical protein [Candidatus Woesearchaeota archaeon]